MAKHTPQFKECAFCGAGVKLDNIAEHKLKLHQGKGALAMSNFGKDEFDALYEKAGSMINRGEFEESAELFKLGLTVDKDNYNAWNDLGLAFSHMNMNAPALEAYDNALKLAPENAATLANKGNLLSIKMKRYDEAMGCYDKAVRYDPMKMNAWYNKGVMHTKAKEYEEAMKCMDRAIGLNEEYYMAWFAKGQIAAALGMQEMALECLEKAYVLDPDYATEARDALLEGKENFHHDSNMGAKTRGRKRSSKA